MQCTTTTRNDTAIVWFRNDLRIEDNPALQAASRHSAVLPLFIRETVAPGRPLGAARSWWLHHSLARLADKLASLGAPLILLTGDPAHILPEIVAGANATAVYWNRRYEPARQTPDTELKNALRAVGVATESFPGHLLLHEPTRLRTGGGGAYKVYTPFWRALEPEVENRPTLPAPQSLAGTKINLKSERLDDWALLPTSPDWSGGLGEAWTPGENGAQARLSAFLEDRICGYAERRDFPAMNATSGLSPHLAHGEITPAQILEALKDSDTACAPADRTVFRKEVGWREFSWHLLVNQPDLPRRNHNSRFDAFPWLDNAAALAAWRDGMTGYPLVDAGMRQLWQTGWMHNRVRMVTASFLTKHLMIDWRQGEAWFWDTLVDADPASNAASWQWVAGSGADASPYFRIFNPVLQGEKFDCDGAYVRRFVPELEQLPAKYVHRPWCAPGDVLRSAGVRLGETYPRPVVDHRTARNRALAAYQQTKDAA